MSKYLDRVREEIRLPCGSLEEVIKAEEFMDKGFLKSFLEYLFDPQYNPGRRIGNRSIVGTIRRFVEKIAKYPQVRREYQNILDYVDDPKSSKYLDKVIKYGIRLPYGWDRDEVVEAERFMNESFLEYLLNPRYNIGPRLFEDPKSALGATERFTEKVMRYPSLKRYYKNILNYVNVVTS